MGEAFGSCLHAFGEAIGYAWVCRGPLHVLAPMHVSVFPLAVFASTPTSFSSFLTISQARDCHSCGKVGQTNCHFFHVVVRVSVHNSRGNEARKKITAVPCSAEEVGMFVSSCGCDEGSCLQCCLVGGDRWVNWDAPHREAYKRQGDVHSVGESCRMTLFYGLCFTSGCGGLCIISRSRLKIASAEGPTSSHRPFFEAWALCLIPFHGGRRMLRFGHYV